MTPNGEPSIESNNNLIKSSSLSHDLGIHGEKMCPHLRLVGDKDTVVGYPSELNHCLRINPTASPINEYQREYCLTEKHRECKVLLSEKQDKSTIEEIFGRKKLPRTFRYLALLIIIGLIGGLMIIKPGWIPSYGLFSNKQSTTIGIATPQDITQTLVVIFTKTAVLTPTKTMTPIPPTVTPTPIPPRFLETPIGLNIKYVIHQVVEGDTLISLADIYGTTVDAIIAANEPLLMPIRDDSFLVVPYNHADLAIIKPLTSYKINYEEKSVAYLAARLGFDAAVIADLNAVPLEHVFTVDEWILLPKILEESN